MADKDLVLDRDALADECVALNLASGTNGDVFLDLDESTDPCIVAYLASIQINERVQGHVSTQTDVWRDPDAIRRIRSLVHRGRHCY